MQTINYFTLDYLVTFCVFKLSSVYVECCNFLIHPSALCWTLKKKNITTIGSPSSDHPGNAITHIISQQGIVN